MSGSSATSNFFNLTGTQPTTLSAETSAVLLSITGAGSSGQENFALQSLYNAGWTGSVMSAAIVGKNANIGTGASFANTDFTTGVWGTTSAGSTGMRVGVFGDVGGSGTGYGIGVAGVGRATGNGQRIGVYGTVSETPGSPTTVVGGMFQLSQPNTPTLTAIGEAALVATNASRAADIFRLYDSTTLVASVADGGAFITGSAVGAANAVSIQETAGQITFEGATSDAFQTRVTARDPTADNTITIDSTTYPWLATCSA